MQKYQQKVFFNFCFSLFLVSSYLLSMAFSSMVESITSGSGNKTNTRFVILWGAKGEDCKLEDFTFIATPTHTYLSPLFLLDYSTNHTSKQNTTHVRGGGGGVSTNALLKMRGVQFTSATGRSQTVFLEPWMDLARTTLNLVFFFLLVF